MIIIKRISRCVDCPFYSTEQGGLMACANPLVRTMEESYIIDQDNRLGIPVKCPLRKESITITVRLA